MNGSAIVPAARAGSAGAITRAGLERASPQALKDAFEALLMGELLTPLQNSLRRSGLFPQGSAGEIYGYFWKQHLSNLLAGSIELLPGWKAPAGAEAAMPPAGLSGRGAGASPVNAPELGHAGPHRAPPATIANTAGADAATPAARIANPAGADAATPAARIANPAGADAATPAARIAHTAGADAAARGAGTAPLAAAERSSSTPADATHANPAAPATTLAQVPPQGGAGVTGGLLARLRPFDGTIRTAAEEAGIGANWVRAVIIQESGGRSEAVSPKGARGLMQLLPATAEALGVRDAFDPLENIRAGARYLGSLLRRFGEMPLALAAYNAGPTRVAAYGGVPPFEETQRYIARVVALKADLDRLAGSGP